MRTSIEKAMLLGLGLAAEGKARLERAAEDLAVKGEASRLEARSLVQELIVRGEESRGQLESKVQERMQNMLSGSKSVTEEQLQKLELRIEALEHSEGEISREDSM